MKAAGNRGLSPIIPHAVRAAMVVRPQDYRWTSYHANALGKVSRIIKPHEEYLRLGKEDEARQIAYRALFKAHLDEETVGQIRNATNGNYALGSERFQKEIGTMLGRRANRGQSGRPSKDTSVNARQGKLL